MTKQAFAKPLPLAPAPLPETPIALHELPVRAPVPLRRDVPNLDADFDDLVSGYGAADAWYEP